MAVAAGAAQNNGNQSNNAGSNGNKGQKAKRPDLWRPVPQLADPTPITPAADPTALIWSLGDLPLQGQGENAKHYVSKVVERAAMLATALAHSAGLLAEPDADED